MDASIPLHALKAQFLRHHAPSVAARHKLRDELRARVDECREAEGALRGAISVHRALPDERKGWFLPVVALVSAAAVLLEWYPAHLAALTYQSAEWGEIMALTAALAVLGAALGDFGGELLRGYRDPAARRPWPHLFFLVLVSICAVAYLWTGYEIRLAYALAVGIDYGVSRAVMALGLVVLAALGMVFAAVASYHAESWEAFTLRLRIQGLGRTVRRLTREVAHLRRTLAHVDHECQVAVQPVVAAAMQDPGDARLAPDQVTAFVLGDGRGGPSHITANADAGPHESLTVPSFGPSNGRHADGHLANAIVAGAVSTEVDGLGPA